MQAPASPGIIHIHHAVTRLFPWAGALRAKHKSFRPAGYYPDVRPPTGNAFVSSCLAESQFHRPLHVLVLEIPYSCFDLPVCQPAGSHCPRSPQPECGRPGRGCPRSPPTRLSTLWSVLFPVPPPRFSTSSRLRSTPSPLLCSSFPDALVPGSSDGRVGVEAGCPLKWT